MKKNEEEKQRKNNKKIKNPDRVVTRDNNVVQGPGEKFMT